MTSLLRIVCLLLVILPSIAATTEPTTRLIPIGPAYAATAVNACLFRDSSILSAGGFQFVTYYDPAGHVVVARRTPPSAEWDIAVQPFKGNVKDAHNVAVLGISSDGLIHLAYDHHANRLHYRVSSKPYDIRSFSDEVPMTGQLERSVTYPQFISAPDGTLYFFYRDGASGNGNLLLNRYDAASHQWAPLAHPLIDGQNQCNPYWWRPAIGADCSIHLAWCWRDSPNAQTNHDICYTRSNDGGKTWLRSDGSPQQTPITRDNAEIVAAIPKNSNLINQCASAVDASGHPHLAQYFNDDNGIPQYVDIYFNGKTWTRTQVSHRTAAFSLSGSGSLAIPISRPEIVSSKDGTVCLITRDASETGNGIRLFESREPFSTWQAIDLTHDDLGNWEPTYDLSAARDQNKLDLFVIPVEQGNHERTTNFAPQQAQVLEMDLP